MRVFSTISACGGSPQIGEGPLTKFLDFLETKFLCDEVGLLCVICDGLNNLGAPLTERRLAPSPKLVMQKRAVALGNCGVRNVPN